MLLRGPVADLLVSDGGEVLELEDVNVLCKALVQAKDPPPLRELQREVALLLRQKTLKLRRLLFILKATTVKASAAL